MQQANVTYNIQQHTTCKNNMQHNHDQQELFYI
jgi:hypothetical protein